jgi:hypothetical protein
MERQYEMVAAENASGHSAAEPMPLSLAERLSAEIAGLEQLDLAGLRGRWRRLFRTAAPPHLPKHLLFRIVAYRIQANAFGDLDQETIRHLDRLARERQPRRVADAKQQRSESPPPLVPPDPNGRSLKPGAILVREHAGVLHRVVVMENGFSWEGKTFRSLSQAAQAITGTNWSGPRFFGLRGKQNTGRSSGVGSRA